MREKEKKISWTTEDFRVYYHLVLNTMTFMGIIIFSFGNEQPTDLRQGKSHTVCINFLPLCTVKPFPFVFIAWLLFSEVDLRIMKDTGQTVQAGAHFFSHLNCWDSSPMRPSPPHTSEGTDTNNRGVRCHLQSKGFPHRLLSLQSVPNTTLHKQQSLWEGVITLQNSLICRWWLGKREQKTWMMEDRWGAVPRCAQHEL